jgi:signal recognition particle subunit SEC65
MSKKSQDKRRRMRRLQFASIGSPGISRIPSAINILGIPPEVVRSWTAPRADAGPQTQHLLSSEPVTKENDAAFAAIATNAWRAKKKMLDVETGEPKDEMRRVYRHVEAILDALTESGVEIMDPCGQAYDTGLPVRVVSSEEREGLRREEIVETLKPAVRRQGKTLQQCEVVLGVPKQTTATSATSPIDATQERERQ